jgi:outer membrane murein-binding lipoprotein Lpp
MPYIFADVVVSLPIAAIFGLIGALTGGAVVWGQLSTTIRQLTTSVTKLENSVDVLAKTVTKLESRVDVMEAVDEATARHRTPR